MKVPSIRETDPNILKETPEPELGLELLQDNHDMPDPLTNYGSPPEDVLQQEVPDKVSVNAESDSGSTVSSDKTENQDQVSWLAYLFISSVSDQ